MARSKMCESCVHTKVCMHDKNLLGDVFVLGHPSFFDNEALYEEFKRREKEGFPCDDYMRIVRCKDCIFSKPYNEKWIQPKMLNHERWCELYGTRHQNWYCADGERRDDEAD